MLHTYSFLHLRKEKTYHMDLERHEGKETITEFYFGGELLFYIVAFELGFAAPYLSPIHVNLHIKHQQKDTKVAQSFMVGMAFLNWISIRCHRLLNCNFRREPLHITITEGANSLFFWKSLHLHLNCCDNKAFISFQVKTNSSVTTVTVITVIYCCLMLMYAFHPSALMGPWGPVYLCCLSIAIVWILWGRDKPSCGSVGKI